MVDHTPGPWKQNAWSNEYDGVPIRGNGSVVAIAQYLGGTNQAVKNARLIAAAPELLDALRFAHKQLNLTADWIEGEGFKGTACGVRMDAMKIRDVIARATGDETHG